MEALTAKIFISALQGLPKNEQLAVFRWIEAHREEFEKMQGDETISESESLFRLSMSSFAEEWGAEENDIWDDFYEQTK